MVHLVEEAQTQRAPSQRLTDWFGRNYTIGVLAFSAAVLVGAWLGLGESFRPAFYRAMTVLVVASPCAVVISIPAAILTAITSAARSGVLFKGGAALEICGRLRSVAFDKTGTLTVGRPRLVEIVPAAGVAPDELLALAAAAEGRSEHPLAQAVLDGAKERGLEPAEAEDVEALVGRGLRARVGGRTVLVGKPGLFGEELLAREPDVIRAADRLRAEGRTVLFAGDDRRLLGVLAVADTLRPGTADALAALRGLGVARLVMLTGDNAAVARTIAAPLGLDFDAELLPEDKLDRIRTLRRTDGPVAMVGDGINDAPALALADLGISLGKAGTDVALETADVVLVHDDLRLIPHAVGLARRARTIVVQNLAFAFCVMGLLLVATFVAPLPLPVAVAGHEGSTVLVILNGLRLLAVRRPREPGQQG
jgi:Cd2+/Zn2+-exporting ATPase